MKILSCGKVLLPRMQSETLQAFFRRSLVTSCFSHQAKQQVEGPDNKNYSASLPVSGSLLQANYRSRNYSSQLLPWTPPGQNVHLIGSCIRKFVPPEITLGLSSYKTNTAHLHTSACHNQVVHDEGDDSTSRIGRWWRRHRAEIKSAPMPALVLGFSGLIPFVAPAVYSIATMSCGPNIAFAQLAYGACILSLLGGVRWGYAVSPDGNPTWPSLSFGVLPSLVAWLGLMMPIPPGLFCIIAGLALAGIVDSRFKSYPSWFRSLGFFLSTFAILSISVTFAFSIMFPPPAPEHGYNFKKLIKIAQIIVQD